MPSNPFSQPSPTPFQDLTENFSQNHGDIKYQIKRKDWKFYVIGNADSYAYYIHKRALSSSGNTVAAVNSVSALKQMAKRGVSTCLYHDMHEEYTEPLWVKDLAYWIKALPEAYDKWGEDLVSETVTVGRIRGAGEEGLGLERANEEFRGDLEWV